MDERFVHAFERFVHSLYGYLDQLCSITKQTEI